MRWRSIVPFLRAANSLPGVLAVFLIDKRLDRLVAGHSQPNTFPELVVAERGWNPKAFHRLCLVANQGSLLVRALSAPSQDILWVTDQDEIAPNPTKHDHAGHVIHHHIGTYAPDNNGLFVFVTTEADLGARKLEDVVAIPDLAAGGLADIVSAVRGQLGQGISRVCVPLPFGLTAKAELVASWFFGTPGELSRFAVLIEPSRCGGLAVEVIYALTLADSGT